MTVAKSEEGIVKSEVKFSGIEELGPINGKNLFYLSLKRPCYCGEKHGTPDHNSHSISQEEADLFDSLQEDDEIEIVRKAGRIINVKKLPTGSVVF